MDRIQDGLTQPELLWQSIAPASSVARGAQNGGTRWGALLLFFSGSAHVHQRTDQRRLGHGEVDARDRANPHGILFDTRETIPYLGQVGVSDSAVHAIKMENLGLAFRAFHS